MNTHRILVSAAWLLFATACASTQEVTREQPAKPAGNGLLPSQIMPDEPFRATRPEPLPVKAPFAGPAPQVSTLPSGATVLVNENHKLPLVAVEVVVRVGRNGTPKGKAGLPELTAAMLEEGTQKRTATLLAAQLENLAAELSTEVSDEFTRIHLNCLAETLPQALELLSDVVQFPAFRTEDLERARGIAITQAVQRRGHPSARAYDTLERVLYGDASPLASPPGGTPESLKALTRAELETFHSRWFRPNNAAIVVSGDVNAKQITRMLAENFRKWKRAPLPALPKLVPVAQSERRILLVERDGLSQSQVLFGGPGPAASHEDALKLRLANNVLGGLFSSRLNQNLRQDKGYSYGVFARPELQRDSGVLMTSGGIISKHTVAAVAEMEKELARISTGELTDEEVARAKFAFNSSLPSNLETNDAIASALGELTVLGLPTDYFRTLSSRVEALTRADVADAAKRYFQSGSARWPIVVVGPGEGFEGKLKALQLGTVERTAFDVR